METNHNNLRRTQGERHELKVDPRAFWCSRLTWYEQKPLVYHKGPIQRSWGWTVGEMPTTHRECSRRRDMQLDQTVWSEAAFGGPGCDGKHRARWRHVCNYCIVLFLWLGLMFACGKALVHPKGKMVHISELGLKPPTQILRLGLNPQRITGTLSTTNPDPYEEQE